MGASGDPGGVRFLRRREVGALARRAGEPWACLGTPARGVGAVGTAAEMRRDRDRCLAVLAEAFEEASDPTARIDLDEALLVRLTELDLATSLYALRCLVGLVCHQSGETPRTILDAEFALSPGDDFWRAEIGD